MDEICGSSAKATASSSSSHGIKAPLREREESEPSPKYVHVHRFKYTQLYGAWFTDPTIRGKKKRLYFGSHQTAYLAARAQDRAALKYKPHALDPSRIRLNFKEEDYAADEELRNMLTNKEFCVLLRKESRLNYTIIERTPCLKRFYEEELAKGNLVDEHTSKPLTMTLQEYLDKVMESRQVRQVTQRPQTKQKRSKVLPLEACEQAICEVAAVVGLAPRHRRRMLDSNPPNHRLNQQRTPHLRAAPKAGKTYVIGGLPLRPVRPALAPAPPVVRAAAPASADIFTSTSYRANPVSASSLGQSRRQLRSKPSKAKSKFAWAPASPPPLQASKPLHNPEPSHGAADWDAAATPGKELKKNKKRRMEDPCAHHGLPTGKTHSNKWECRVISVGAKASCRRASTSAGAGSVAQGSTDASTLEPHEPTNEELSEMDLVAVAALSEMKFLPRFKLRRKSTPLLR